LDKFEYKIRAEEIKTLIAQGDYIQAAEIADMIDWRRVKSVMMLCTISDLYKINRRFEDARDMLLLAYDRHPGGRTIVYSLCELSIKMEEFVQAIEYYKEFVLIAPKDTGRYILQYKIYEAQDVGLEERIAVLEELKSKDYREKWAYELAYLYHRVGLATRCVEECDELILWFGEGKYVIKAMELKMLHEPLTAEQQMKYDGRFGIEQPEPDIIHAPTHRLPTDEMNIQVKTMDVGHYNTINLQKELAAGLKEVLERPKQVSVDTDALDTIQIEEVDGEELIQEEIKGSEVFFGEDAYPVPEAKTVQGDRAPQSAGHMRELHLADESTATESNTPIETNAASDTEGEEIPHPTAAAEDISDTVMNQLRMEHMEHIPLPPKMADVLSMESDGQIRLVLPEEERVEKQITGQLSIADILSEWERMKKERVDKSKEEIRRHVQEQTGPMFTEFEASIRDGLLEKLEKEAAMTEESAASVPMAVKADTAVKAADAGLSGTSVASTVTGLAGTGGAHAGLAGAGFMGTGSGLTDSDIARVGVASTGATRAGVVNTGTARAGIVNAGATSTGTARTSVASSGTARTDVSSTGTARTDESSTGTERASIGSEYRENVPATDIPQDRGKPESYMAFEEELAEQTDRSEGDFALLGLGSPDPVRKKHRTDSEKKAYLGADYETGEIQYEELEAALEQIANAKKQMTEQVDAHELIESDYQKTLVNPPEILTEDDSSRFEDTGSDPIPNTEQTPNDADTVSVNMHTDRQTGIDQQAITDQQAAADRQVAINQQKAVDQQAVINQQAATNQQIIADQQAEATDETDESPIVRNLSKEEKELYAPYVQSKAAREQLAQAIDAYCMDAAVGNVIITGEEGLDTLTLAKSMIRQMQASDTPLIGKTATISGAALNKKEVTSIVSQLSQGALIIKKASEMTKETAEKLCDALEQQSLGILIFMEDTKKAMDRLLESVPELSVCFSARIDLATMSNDTLVAFGRKYAKELEYAIDELGILALHTRINDLQTSEHVVTVLEVKDIVDEAIRHVRKKTPGHFFDILLAKRYDENDMIILREKDFIR
jgi:hypothetical protein